MKFFFSLVLMLLINYPFCYSQNTCKYEVGDILYFDRPGILLKVDSTAYSSIIATVDDIMRNRFEVEIINEYAINYLLKVRIFVGDFLEDDSITLKDYLKFNNTICWVDSKSIHYIHGYGINNDSIPYWTENIRYLNYLRINNYCKYYPEDLAESYQQRGIDYYNKKAYSEAVYDLSKSIEIMPSYKIYDFYIISSYYYRAYAKMELLDFIGAISDFDIAIKLCFENKLNNNLIGKNQFPCQICSEKTEKIFELLTGQECCYEELICKKAYCNFQLKKYQTALSDLNLLITSYPMYGRAYYLRGQLKYILNDKVGCCKDLSRAGEFGIKEAYDEIKKRCNE